MVKQSYIVENDWKKLVEVKEFRGLLEHIDWNQLRTLTQSFLDRTLPIVGEDKSIIVVEVFDREGNMFSIGHAHHGTLTEAGREHLEKRIPIPKGVGLIWNMIQMEISNKVPNWVRKGLLGDKYTITDLDSAKEHGSFIPVIEGTKSILLVPIWLGLDRQYLIGGLAVDSKNELAFQDYKVSDFISVLGLLQGFVLDSYYYKFHDQRLSLDIRLFHRGYLIEFLTTKLLSPTDNGKLYVCLFDINNFRDINKKYGHIAGDKVIDYFCRCLHKICVGYEHEKQNVFAVPFRYGGDEFVITLKADSKQDVEDFIQKIDVCLANNKSTVKEILGGDDVGINFSVEITKDKKMLQYTDLLVKAADDLMYLSKQRKEKVLNRNVLCFDGEEPQVIVP